ncbi:MAG: beta-N-acetylglucosaminidase domain-containing protein [Clostridia bacterium]|nr:beta-N-acetylglucosaminidase domain-containing protein [Clostridia bacterium]
MIYPTPQKNSLTGDLIEAKSFSVIGEYSETVKNIFSEYGISSSGGYIIEIKMSDDATVNNEEYFLNVSREKMSVNIFSRRGAFRAAHTLAKLISENELKTGKLEDYPLFKKRGYIEGFYGPTWENQKRLSVMKLMAKYGMNTFFYAPKDDIYHREKWRELYPEKELNELKKLYVTACENELDFHWAIGPGLTYNYSSDADFALLINKIKSIYDIGVRNFGLLLDDIPDEFQYDDDRNNFESIVDAQIYLVNKTYDALKRINERITLTVCPTQYHGDATSEYISKFGSSIPDDVSLFWTGAEICSRVLTVREADELFDSTKHRPLYWDNFPVNDCEMFHEMHLGAIIGRDKELYKHCEGIISNVMEYAECSKIPLMTIADFLWNPIAYNSEKSLKNAHKEILGDKAELFALFADHLGVSCLSKYSSAFMSETLSRVLFLDANGQKDESLKELKEYNHKMRKCLEMLEDENIPLFAELKKWVKKFSMCCDLLDVIYNVRTDPTNEKKAILEKKLEAYNYNAVILTGFCLREMAEKTLKI